MASAGNIQNQITCSICQLIFKSPLQLPCKHTYCIECVSHIKIDEDILSCPKCGETCTKLQCEQDVNAEKLIELFENCKKDKVKPKESIAKKKNFHFSLRSTSKKMNISGSSSEKIIEKHFASNKHTEIPISDDQLFVDENTAILTKNVQRISSSTNSNESDKEICPICIKNSVKWRCIKCKYKSCMACQHNYPLKCKDDSNDHIFILDDDSNNLPESETDDNFQSNEDISIMQNSTEVPKIEIKSIVSESVETNSKVETQSIGKQSTKPESKKVTFPGLLLEDANESSSDSIFKPNFRDSIALTKDKKSELQDITTEVVKIEEIGSKQMNVLKQYHQYMKDVKIAGFNLIDQTESIMMEKVASFFSNIRKDYETGFDEMTASSRVTEQNLEKDLELVQRNALILEDIVDNNDTRAMLDETFLEETCDELDTHVTRIGKVIVECQHSGLSESKENWNEQSKGIFEKQMNVRILTAVENEMKQNLLPEMTHTIKIMKPQVEMNPKSQATTNKKKIFDCLLS